MGREATSADYSYFARLFDLARSRLPAGNLVPLPPPEPGSSLARDDDPLNGWGAAPLIRSMTNAGAAQVLALERLVVIARTVDTFSTWTLMRSALEDFATCCWLLDGRSVAERRGRALSLWGADMGNRQQWEDDTGHQVTGEHERTGGQRQQEIEALAVTLGLAAVKPRPGTIITTAAEGRGLDARKVRAAWRAGSGYAHGKHWPQLRAAQPVHGITTGEGTLVSFVIDHVQLRIIADACTDLLAHVLEHYPVRAGVA